MTEPNTHNTDLPDGWVWARHSDVSSVNIKPDFSQIDDEVNVSFIPMAAVEERTGRYNLHEVRNFGDVKRGYTAFKNGDLIFAKITPCMENGKIAIVDGLKNGIGFGSTEFHTSRFHAEINADLYFYYFGQEVFRRDARREMTGSAGQLRVPAKFFREIYLPLPPLAEQHRIVAKIEELFSDLDASVAALIQAQGQLRIYRQAVLKYAFEGRLTAAWREQHTPPPATDLLAQIKAERAARYRQQQADWQAEVKAWEATGKSGRKPSKPRSVKEVPPLSEAELAELPVLPEGWEWAKLGNTVERIQIGPFGSQLHNKDYVKNGIPLINPKHIKDQKIIPESGVSISNTMYDDLPQYILSENDIIMGRRGEMGRCAPITDREDGWFCGSGSLFIRSLPFFDARLYSLLLSDTRVKSFLSNNSIGTTFQNLNSTILNNIPIPIFSFQEQQTIMDEIDSRLSLVDKLEETIAAALQQAEALRQSILKQAFAGKLVPQDANDEPASMLLERIRKAKLD